VTSKSSGGRIPIMNINSIENSIKGIENSNSSKNYNFEVLKRFSHKIEDKNIDSILECLDRTLKNAEKIGAGKNAEVFKLEKPWNDICVKVFKKEREVVNEFDTEFEFQEAVNDLNIFTPENLLSIENKETNQQYLIMERINGLSLRDLLDGKNEKQHKELKKNSIVFFDELKKNIETMHKENIHHRDLHEGNVMFDFKTKKPVIIDFGSSTRTLSNDSDMEIYSGEGYRPNPATGRNTSVTITFPKDNDQVKELKKLFQ
jgi:serine/threonine protein kinase